MKFLQSILSFWAIGVIAILLWSAEITAIGLGHIGRPKPVSSAIRNLRATALLEKNQDLQRLIILHGGIAQTLNTDQARLAKANAIQLLSQNNSLSSQENSIGWALGIPETQGSKKEVLGLPDRWWQKEENKNYPFNVSAFQKPIPEKKSKSIGEKIDEGYESGFNPNMGQELSGEPVEDILRALNEKIREKLSWLKTTNLESLTAKDANSLKGMLASENRVSLLKSLKDEDVILYNLNENGMPEYFNEDTEYNEFFKIVAIRSLSVALKEIQPYQFNTKEEFESVFLNSVETYCNNLFFSLGYLKGNEETIDPSHQEEGLVIPLVQSSIDKQSKKMHLYLPTETISAKIRNADISLETTIGSAGTEVIEKRHGRIVFNWDDIFKNAGIAMLKIKSSLMYALSKF